MARKKDNFATYTLAELPAMQVAGQTHSDWASAEAKPVPGGSDLDDAMEPVSWATTELPMPRRKEHTNLRIDADVMEFFRQQGKGYQTKINAVLRSYVDQMQHKSR